VKVLAAFAALQKEYATVMSVVQAVRAELEAEGGKAEILSRVDGILANEAELSVTVFEEQGAKKRRVGKSLSQEALRAEIARDASALLDLKGIQAALAERRVDQARLSALKSSADRLAGLLASRAAAKGAARASVQGEREAANSQGEKWRACYRLLRALGARDERVRSLLSEASR
jgi:hypothetical protein